MAVVVAVKLADVDQEWTDIADITEAILIRIELLRVGRVVACVDVAAEPVSVDVIERIVGAGIAGVAQAIGVPVVLTGVGSVRAIVRH